MVHDETYLLPQCRLASKTFIRILRRLCGINFDNFSKELGLIHVVYGILGIVWILKLDISKAPVELSRVWSIWLPEKVSNELLKYPEDLR